MAVVAAMLVGAVVVVTVRGACIVATVVVAVLRVVSAAVELCGMSW